VNEHNGNYGIARGAYQADSTDYKTLNLLQAKKDIFQQNNSGVYKHWCIY